MFVQCCLLCLFVFIVYFFEMLQQEVDEDMYLGWQMFVVLVGDVDGQVWQVLFVQYWYQVVGDDVVIDDVVGLDQDVQVFQCCCVDDLVIVGLYQGSDVELVFVVIVMGEMQQVGMVGVVVYQQVVCGQVFQCVWYVVSGEVVG